MKYILIFAAVVFLVRIDLIMNFFDKQANKFQNRPVEITPEDVGPATKLVPVDTDLALKTSPRKSFISMLEDFNSSPDENIKLKAIELLRANPTMFDDKLNKDLESAVYRWRNHLLQRSKETQSFLLEMMKSLRGENLEMAKRVLSFTIDADMTDFLNMYSKSSDLNCLLIGYLGDPLPEIEKYNELSERQTVLDAVLTADKLAPEVKLYAQRCQIVLKLNLDKLKAVVLPLEDSESPAPVQAPAPESSPAPTTTEPTSEPAQTTPGITP